MYYAPKETLEFELNEEALDELSDGKGDDDDE
jgi:hypothetical protein